MAEWFEQYAVKDTPAAPQPKGEWYEQFEVSEERGVGAGNEWWQQYENTPQQPGPTPTDAGATFVPGISMRDDITNLVGKIPFVNKLLPREGDDFITADEWASEQKHKEAIDALNAEADQRFKRAQAKEFRSKEEKIRLRDVVSDMPEAQQEAWAKGIRLGLNMGDPDVVARVMTDPQRFGLEAQEELDHQHRIVEVQHMPEVAKVFRSAIDNTFLMSTLGKAAGLDTDARLREEGFVAPSTVGGYLSSIPITLIMDAPVYAASGALSTRMVPAGTFKSKAAEKAFRGMVTFGNITLQEELAKAASGEEFDKEAVVMSGLMGWSLGALRYALDEPAKAVYARAQKAYRTISPKVKRSLKIPQQQALMTTGEKPVLGENLREYYIRMQEKHGVRVLKAMPYELREGFKAFQGAGSAAPGTPPAKVIKPTTVIQQPAPTANPALQLKDTNLTLEHIMKNPQNYQDINKLRNDLVKVVMAHGSTQSEAMEAVAFIGKKGLENIIGKNRLISEELAAKRPDLVTVQPTAEETTPLPEKPGPGDILQVLQAARKGEEAQLADMQAPTSPESREKYVASLNNRGTRALVGQEASLNGEKVTVVGTHYDAENDVKRALVENENQQLMFPKESSLEPYEAPEQISAREAELIAKDAPLVEQLGPQRYYDILKSTMEAGLVPQGQEGTQIARMNAIKQEYPEIQDRDIDFPEDILAPEPETAAVAPEVAPDAQAPAEAPVSQPEAQPAAPAAKPAAPVPEKAVKPVMKKKRGGRRAYAGVDPVRRIVDEEGGIRKYKYDANIKAVPFSAEMDRLPVRWRGKAELDKVVERLKSEGVVPSDYSESDLLEHLAKPESKPAKSDDARAVEQEQAYNDWLETGSETVNPMNLNVGDEYSVQGDKYVVKQETDTGLVVQQGSAPKEIIPFEKAESFPIDKGSLKMSRPAEQVPRAEISDADIDALEDALEAVAADLDELDVPFFGAEGPGVPKARGYDVLPKKVRRTLARLGAQSIEKNVPIGDLLAEKIGSIKADKLERFHNEILKSGRAILRGDYEQEQIQKEKPGTGEPGGLHPEKESKAGDGSGTKPSGQSAGDTKAVERTAESIIRASAPEHISDSTLKIFVEGAVKSDIPAERIKEFVSDMDQMVKVYKLAAGQLEEPVPKDTEFPNKPNSYILGNDVGTGKTFQIASLIKEVQGTKTIEGDAKLILNSHKKRLQELLDLHKDDRIVPKGVLDQIKSINEAIKEIEEGKLTAPKNILWVTLNQNLINQIENDVLKAYDIKGVDFTTYNQIQRWNAGTGKWEAKDNYDLVVFDESQKVKNVAQKKSTAMAGVKLQERSTLTVYSSATPFENPKQLAYLGNTDIFQNVDEGYYGWAENFGVQWVGANSGIFEGSVEDCIRAQKWLLDAGVLSARQAELPEGFVKANFGKIQLDGEQIDTLNHIDRVFAKQIRKAGKSGSLLKAQQVLMTRRALESFKIPEMLKRLDKELKRGQKALVMTATKSVRDLEEELDKIIQKMADDPKSSFLPHWKEVHEQLPYKFESPIESIMEWAKDNGKNFKEFTGDVTDLKADHNLELFRNNKIDGIVATMAKGGAGLSAHDTIGGHPISQFILTMPWTGTDLAQAVGRAARYGMKSKVDQFFLFSDDPFDLRLAQLVGTRMAQMKAIVHGVEKHATAEQMAAFQFGLLTDIAMRTEIEAAGKTLGDVGETEVLKGKTPDPTAKAASKKGALAPAKEETLKGKTKKGKKLIKKIQKSKGDVGVRSIVEFLDDAAGTELRIGKTQLSKKHPGHFRPDDAIIRANTASSGINMHESGHGMFENLMLMDPKQGLKQSGITAMDAIQEGLGKGSFDRPITRHLLRLTKREFFPDSNASAENTHEGFAEFVRRYVMDYDSIKNMPGLDAIIKQTAKYAPQYMEALTDANMAFHELMQKPWIEIASSYLFDTRATKFPKETGLMDRIVFGAVSRGYAMDKIMPKMFGLIRKTAASNREGLRMARKFRESIKGSFRDVETANAMRLRANTFIHQAIDGSGLRVPAFNRKTGKVAEGVGFFSPSQKRLLEEAGFKVPKMVPHGEMIELSDKSVLDILKPINPKDQQLFEAYGYYRTILARDKQMMRKGKGYNYPGRDVMSISDIKSQVAKYEKDFPEWKKAYKDVQQLYDQALMLGALSGEFSVKDLMKIKGYDIEPIPKADGTIDFKLIQNPAHMEDYWFLERHLEAKGTNQKYVSSGYGEGAPTMGLRRHMGGEYAMESLPHAIHRRITSSVTSYLDNYSRRAFIELSDYFRREKDLPAEAKFIGARMASPLPKINWKKAATLTWKESDKIKGMIADAYSKQLGVDVDPNMINVHFAGMPIWRPAAPDAINVIAWNAGGKTYYRQVWDPIQYEYFAGSGSKGRLFRTLGKVVTPVANVQKKIITAMPNFLFRNVLLRDPRTQIDFAEAKELAIPGLATVMGLMEQLTGGEMSKQTSESILSEMGQEFDPEVYGSKIAQHKKALKRGVVGKSIPKDWTSWPGRAQALLTKPIDYIQYLLHLHRLSAKTEMTSRIGAAAVMRKKGYNMAEALRVMDQSAGHFQERPADPELHELYRMAGFLNARTQINYQIYKKLFMESDPKKAFENWFRIAVWNGAILGSITWGIRHILSSDEEIEAEKERPVSSRSRYFNFKGIKVPYESNIRGFAEAWVHRMLDKWFYDMPVKNRKFKVNEMLRELTGAPGSPSEFTMGFINALWQIKKNKNWIGQPIEPYWIEREEDPEKAAFHDTPEIYITLAKKTGLRPLNIQHFVQSGLGEAYGELIKALDMKNKKQGIEEAADVPYFGKLFIRKPAGFYSESAQKLQDMDSRWNTIQAKMEEIESDPTITEEQKHKANVTYELAAFYHYAFKEIEQKNTAIKRYKDQMEMVRRGKMNDVYPTQEERDAHMRRIIMEIRDLEQDIVLTARNAVIEGEKQQDALRKK